MKTKFKITDITESWEEEISPQSLPKDVLRDNFKVGARGLCDGAPD